MKNAIVIALVAILAGCGGGGGGSSGGKKRSDDLRLNEFGLNPDSGGTWIEIENFGTREARLAGLALVSRVGESTHAEAVLPDDEPPLPPGGLRAVSIELPAGAGAAEILGTRGKPIHRVDWPALSPAAVPALAGTSYGRTSRGVWRVLDTPTPGAANVDPTSAVLLNEVAADGDWIEIHNPSNVEVDLSGSSLTDDPADPFRWPLPSGSIVPAGGFLLADGALDLPLEGGQVSLHAPDGTLADVYAWDQMGEERSRGRATDGGAGWVAFRDMTPGESNALGLADRTDDPAHRKRAPDYDRVFDLSKVKTIRIEIDPVEFAKMVKDRTAAMDADPLDPDFGYFECTVRFEGEVWRHVGVRYKGVSSAWYPRTHGFEKYPLKLDFDEFEDDYPEWKNQRFWGLKKLNFSNLIWDPTYLREFLCLEMMREEGITASRVAPFAVFLDTGKGDRYQGLYAGVEQVDGTFLKDRYGEDEGNLYKPEGYDAGLEKFVKSVYIKKSNEDEEDWSDVIELIDVLNANYPDVESQKAAIEGVFDVESFLPWLAVTATTVHFDSYMTNNHNYYLYHHEDGRFRFITWDHNMAFASPILDYRAKDAAGWDIVEPGDGYRPLIDRILEVPEWREAYLERVRKLLVGRFSEDEFDRRANELHELLAPWVVGATAEIPPWTVLTHPSHFDRGLTEKLTPIGSLAIPGLLTFAKERRAYLHSVLD